MPLNSFADVQKFFNDFINMHKITVGQPHGEFWNTLSYTDFVTGTVPGSHRSEYRPPPPEDSDPD